MSRRHRRTGAACLFAAAAAVAVLKRRGGSIAAAGLGQLKPEHTKVRVGPLDVDALIKDASHWKVTVAEPGKDAAAVFSNLDGTGTEFSVAFDSAQSKVPMPSWVERLGFSATGNENKLAAAEWELGVYGKHGRHIAATQTDGQIIYDASIGFEVPTPADVTVRYAADAKRRPVVNGTKFDVKPTEFQQGVGLKMDVPNGMAKFSAYQTGVSLGLDNMELTAAYQGKLEGVRGSPTVGGQAALKQGNPEMIATLGMVGPKGTKGAVDVGVKNGVVAVRGRGDVSYEQEIAPGVTVKAATGLQVTPVVAGPAGMPEGAAGPKIGLQPVTVAAIADLTKVSEGAAGPGSEAAVSAQYSMGASRPSAILGAMKLKTPASTALVNGELDVKGAVDGNGAVMVAVGGKAAIGDAVQLRYSGNTGGNHFAEAVYTPAAAMREAAMQLAATLMQIESSKLPDLNEAPVQASTFARAFVKNGGKPRLQVGFNYGIDGPVGISGEDVLFDTGDGMTETGGGAVTNPHAAIKARKEAVAARIAGADPGLGKLWIQA